MVGESPPQRAHPAPATDALDLRCDNDREAASAKGGPVARVEKINADDADRPRADALPQGNAPDMSHGATTGEATEVADAGGGGCGPTGKAKPTGAVAAQGVAPTTTTVMMASCKLCRVAVPEDIVRHSKGRLGRRSPARSVNMGKRV